MPEKDRIKIRCYVIIPLDRELLSLKNIVKSTCKDLGINLTMPEKFDLALGITDTAISEIAKCDLFIADISSNSPNIFYEIGLAQALGKPVVFIVKEGTSKLPYDFLNYIYLQYSITSEGLSDFQKIFRKILTNFIDSPREFRLFLPFSSKIIHPPPYLVDLEKLDSREYENLCFELIAQMGFRRVEWGKEFREIDVVATLPKKDPDGYEYQELWLISMGQRAPVEKMLDMVLADPEFLNTQILRYPDHLEEVLLRYKIRSDVPITFLFILGKQEMPPEVFEHKVRRFERRSKERSSPFAIRVRWWDSIYLTNLIQQYPQIAYKYFSEDSRLKSQHRKTPEEMYKDNVKLNARLQNTLSALEEEKKKRFIAERNAAWKDVAFKAAHKLGNPIDAIDTFLLSLKKRLQNHEFEEAVHIAIEMDTSIEESKTVIAQFKSLTKVQEINVQAENLLPIIQHSCTNARENGVIIDIQSMENCPQVMIDPIRIGECFNELVANAQHWFDKPVKKISISISKPLKKELPGSLDKSHSYIRILFEDNGQGISLENKERVFGPFFTTYPHGTGLGLSLVKSIIDNHGGLIYENGKPNEGASFEIFIPIA